MEKNVGVADKVIRIVTGVTLVVIGVYEPIWFAAVGVGIMIPAFLGFDPLYSVFGFSTQKKE